MRTTADRLTDALERGFQNIKSVPDDVARSLRERLREGLITGASVEDVLRAALRAKEDEVAGANHDAATRRELLRELWEKTRSDYERILQTESVNAYARAQLETWQAQGVKRVRRREIMDTKTCTPCRQLCEPGKDIEDIAIVIARPNPVTDVSHPRCRGSYIPVLDDLRDELEKAERAFLDLDNEDTETHAQGVPADQAPSIGAMSEEMRHGGDFGWTQDVTTLPEWDHGELPEGSQAAWWTDPSGKTWIGDAARDTHWPTYAMALEDGRREWDALPDRERSWVRRRFDGKNAEAAGEVEGVKIVGAAPFINLPAARAPESYFAESYAHYVVDPLSLRTLDSAMYEWLRDHVFDGTEYLERGGVK